MKLAVTCLSALVAGCAARAPVVSVRVPPRAPVETAVPSTAAAEPEPPAVPGPGPLGGYLATGDARPPMQTLRFDLDALPVATWGEAWPKAGLSLRTRKDAWSLWVRTTIYAEVIVASARPSGEKGPTPVGFTVFTGGSFADGVIPACGPGTSGKRLVVWDGFAPAGWTDDGVDVEMEEGDFDLATCRGTPVRSLRGRASAVVPGYVYGVRVRDEDDEGKPRESLVVFLPRGSLVSTAADPRTPLDAANTGAFTRLTFPLEQGSAGSASLRVSPASLAMWSRLRRQRGSFAYADTSPLAENLLLAVDVAWQGDVRLGSVSLAIPAAKGRKAFAGLLAAAQKRAM